MRFGSLFAGIGGFDLAFQRAGLRCAWQVEKDADCLRVLSHHWPDVPRLTDVHDAGKGGLSPVDLICGGFPCQDLSTAGKRAGLKGGRSSLFYEMTRVVDELRPAFLLWENVPGLLSSRRGHDFLAVLTELDRLGYAGAWTTLDAQFFGLAQRRRRVFGLFTRLGAGAARCAEILALATRCGGHPAAGGEEGAGTAPAVTPGARRTSGNRAGEKIVAAPVGTRAGNVTNNDGKRGTPRNLVFQANGAGSDRAGAPSLSAGEDNGSNWWVAHAMTGEGHDASEDGMGRGVPLVAQPVRSNAYNNSDPGMEARGLVAFNIIGMAQEGKNHAYEATVSGCLQHKGLSASGNEAGTVVAFNESQSGTREGGVNATLDSHKGSRRQEGVRDGMMVRRLTPLECARLQGFPDDFLDLTPPLSDSSKYRLLGNAVAVPVVAWIAGRLREAV